MATGTLPDSDQDKKVSSQESDGLFNRTFGDDVARGIDEAEKHAATGGNDSDKLLDDLENDPNTPPGGWSNNVQPGGITKKASGLWSKLRKQGPFVAIFSGIGLGGAGLLFLAVPGIFLFHILSSMFGTLDPSSTALTQVTKIMLMNKLGANSATIGPCAVTSVACRFKTPSNKLLLELKNNGITALGADGNPIEIKADTKWPSERPQSFRVSSFATENGKTITIKASDLKAALQDNSAFRSAFNKTVKKVGVRAFSRFSPSYLKVMNKFSFGLSDKLNIKARVNAEGKTLVGDVLNKSIKAFGLESTVSSARGVSSAISLQASKALTRINKASKGSGIVLAMAAQCMANQIPGMLKKALVGVQEQAAVSASAPVVTAISAIKAGDGDPETATELATAFSQTDSNGKSSMDAAGMQYVLNGDKNTTKDPTFQSVTPSGYGDLASSLDLSDAVFNNPISAGTCELILNPVTGGVFAAGVNAAVVGTSASNFGISLAVNWAIGGAFSLILNSMDEVIAGSIGGLFAPGVGNLAQPVVDKMSEPGQVFGNVIPFGVGVTTTNKAAYTFGHYLTTSNLTAYSEVIKQQQIADAELDQTTLSPFDTSSPYTFMGSIASQMAPYYSSFSSLEGSLSFVGSLLPRSIGSIIKPSSVSAADMSLYENACTDPASLKVADGSGDLLAANIFCQPVAATLIPSDWNPDETVNTMLGIQTDGVNAIDPETGKATVPANALTETVEDTIESITDFVPGSTISYADWLDACSDPANATNCTGDDETLQTYSLYTAANEVSVMLDADLEGAELAAGLTDSYLGSEIGSSSQPFTSTLSSTGDQVITSSTDTARVVASFFSLIPSIHNLLRTYGTKSFAQTSQLSTPWSLQRFTLWG